MRKIEREMINAIHARKQWRKANTAVHIGYAGTMLDHYKDAYMSVYLHGHQIARYFYNDDMRLEINHQGWTTNTTKSRLNSLLLWLVPRYRVVQKNWEWFLTDTQGQDVEFNSGWLTV